MEESSTQNIEIKARAPRGHSALRQALAQLGGERQWERHQQDTFFCVPRGRLKLRKETEAGRLVAAQLIPYLRPDCPGPTACHYAVIDVAQPDTVRELFEDMLGADVVVDKTRELWLLHDRTVRVHLDCVAGLGDFLEIEAVVTPRLLSELGAAGAAALQRQRTERLLSALAISDEDLVPVAYADLLRRV
jgi:adenylate cyclase class IV